MKKLDNKVKKINKFKKANTKKTIDLKPKRLSGLFENPITHEIWVCNNMNNVVKIDNVEFLKVHKQDSPREVLLKKEALKFIKYI